MSTTEILEQIHRLPLAQQYELAEQVRREYFEDDLTPEQAAELDRRLAEFENSPRGGIPIHQVKEEMRQKFGW